MAILQRSTEHPASSKQGRGLYSSSGSVIVHGAILVSLVTASYLHVEPLAEPSLRLQFVCCGPPSPPASPPPPPPAGGSAQAHDVKAAEVRVDVPDTVQPKELPSDVPVAREEAMGDSGDGDAIDGDAGGEPAGIPGGMPGGVQYGVLGGVRDGFPGSVLDGLPGDDQPIYLIGDVKPPERTTFVMPKYPEMARNARADGRVILEIVVGRSGDVEKVKVLDSNPLFDLAAVEAVRKWKYRPALLGGRPVMVYLTVRVEFTLK